MGEGGKRYTGRVPYLVEVYLLSKTIKIEFIGE
jgi:hypothetical protein